MYTVASLIEELEKYPKETLIEFENERGEELVIHGKWEYTPDLVFTESDAEQEILLSFLKIPIR